MGKTPQPQPAAVVFDKVSLVSNGGDWVREFSSFAARVVLIHERSTFAQPTKVFDWWRSEAMIAVSTIGVLRYRVSRAE